MKKNHENWSASGFTLVEILIAIAVISILSAIVYVNIDPVGRFEEARNKQRASDVYRLMQAIALYRSDHDGALPGAMGALTDSLFYQIGTGTDCGGECHSPNVQMQNDCLDLGLLKDKGFIPEIPKDPNSQYANSRKTGYYLSIDQYKKISIGSCYEEKGMDQSPREIGISK